MIMQKYQPALDLGLKLNIQNGDLSEENGVLKIKVNAKTPYEKNILQDEIKALGGQNPSDIKADIRIADESVYHRQIVKSGESLSKIAKHYYGDPQKYRAIFKANKAVLKTPDLIHPK